MRTTQSVLETLIKKSRVVPSRRLSREDVEEIISEYQEAVFSTLLDNGYVRISDDIQICLVKLKDRRYVLRGESYMNHRKYKLKMVTSRSIYDKIEDSYNLLLED